MFVTSFKLGQLLSTGTKVECDKYLGVLLDPCLNMKEHLQKTLKSAAARIKLLERMRQSLTSHAAESI